MKRNCKRPPGSRVQKTTYQGSRQRQLVLFLAPCQSYACGGGLVVDLDRPGANLQALLRGLRLSADGSELPAPVTPPNDWLATCTNYKGRDDLQECAFGLLLKSAVMFAVPGCIHCSAGRASTSPINPDEESPLRGKWTIISICGNNRFSRHGLLLGTKDIQFHFRAIILPNHQLSMVVCQTGSFRV